VCNDSKRSAQAPHTNIMLSRYLGFKPICTSREQSTEIRRVVDACTCGDLQTRDLFVSMVFAGFLIRRMMVTRTNSLHAYLRQIFMLLTQLVLESSAAEAESSDLGVASFCFLPTRSCGQ